MITEHAQEQAALYALGVLSPEEQLNVVDLARRDSEFRDLVRSFQRALEQVALDIPSVAPPSSLKDSLLGRIASQNAGTAPRPQPSTAAIPAGLRFVAGADDSGWKALPVAGAWIKLLSFQPDRGYAVLLGKLDPGVRYPAHVNAGPEDFCLLTGDLQISGHALGPGDFHHADAGSAHEENYSINGCTLVAVLTVDDPLVQLALA